MKVSSQDMLIYGLIVTAVLLVFFTPKSEKCCGGHMA
jgi:hypothetical protein